MSNPIGPVTQGGVYGRENAPTGHRCGKCSNPFTSSGGNDACPNIRASQVVPVHGRGVGVMRVIGHVMPRYQVQIGTQALQSYQNDLPRASRYEFDRAFHELAHAYAYAESLAERNEFVRIIDIGIEDEAPDEL